MSSRDDESFNKLDREIPSPVTWHRRRPYQLLYQKYVSYKTIKRSWIPFLRDFITESFLA